MYDLSRIKQSIFLIIDFFTIDFTVVGGEKDKPTFVFLFSFRRLKIFWCLNEINIHFEYLDVSLISFLSNFVVNLGLISINK